MLDAIRSSEDFVVRPYKLLACCVSLGRRLDCSHFSHEKELLSDVHGSNVVKLACSLGKNFPILLTMNTEQ